MGRYDGYRNPNGRTRSDVPVPLDVQADVFSALGSRVVVPLFRSSVIPKPLSGLQPALTVDGTPLVMETLAIVGVPTRALGERVGSLAAQAPTILRALDLLLTGS